MDKMRMESEDIQQDNVAKIAALFPNCVTEARDEDGHLKKAINFELLKQMLSDSVIDGDEAYEFTWVGKKASIVEANRPIRKTLRPVKEDSVNWDTTENLYIEGDNLEVLKPLQESYLGKVKMIYIDPPYNTGNDFIYNDDFKASSEEYADESGEVDEEGNRMFKNTDSNGRFHSDWCSMIYSRLMLARNLLAKDGVVAISIGFHEVCNLIKICQEIFGDRQIFPVTVKTSGGKPNGAINISNEYVVLITPENFIPIPTEEDMKEYASPYHGMNLATFTQVERPNQAYPIYVDPNKGNIVGVGKSLQQRMDDGELKGNIGDYVYDYDEAPNGTVAVWPVSNKGEQCVWRLIPERLLGDWSKGYIKVIPNKSDSTRNAFTIQYLSGGIIDKIANGEIEIYRVSDDPLIPTIDIKNYKTAGSGIASIWDDKRFYTTKGSNEIKELFKGKVFSYPKPVELVSYILKRTTDEASVVLDFFSGSATTAEALMRLNSEDGFKRAYILIQLPEETDDNSDARKAGYKNICEIGKERIRRAAKKIHEDNPDATFDDGFRVLKLDDTNMKDVYYAAGDYSQDLVSMLESNVKPDRTDLDILFGCLLDWGLPLSLPYTSETIDGCMVHTYNDGDLIAFFDENVPESVIKTIAKRQPLRAVFRDSSFASSPEKINVGEIFKSLAPDTRVKVI